MKILSFKLIILKVSGEINIFIILVLILNVYLFMISLLYLSIRKKISFKL